MQQVALHVLKGCRQAWQQVQGAVQQATAGLLAVSCLRRAVAVAAGCTDHISSCRGLARPLMCRRAEAPHLHVAGEDVKGAV
jgi:hypothetical protein